MLQSVGQAPYVIGKGLCFTSASVRCRSGNGCRMLRHQKMVAIRWETWTKEGPALFCCAKIMLLFSPKLFPLVGRCRGQQSSPICLPCWRMRRSGRNHMSFTPSTSWMQMGSLWNQRPSCPSQQVNLRGGSSCKSEARQEGGLLPLRWFQHGLLPSLTNAFYSLSCRSPCLCGRTAGQDGTLSFLYQSPAEIHFCAPWGPAQATGGRSLCSHKLPTPIYVASSAKMSAHHSPFTHRPPPTQTLSETV